MSRKPDPVHFDLPIATSEGDFVAVYSEEGLCALHFPRQKALPKAIAVPDRVRHWHVVVTEALQACLRGAQPGRMPPLDFSSGTVFQQRVWRALTGIPLGQTASYGEVARKIGKAKAVRAVGGACGANPIPVLVPCHRVLAANRRLGGFSGGLDWKRWLLAREGIRFVDPAGKSPGVA